MTRVKICGLKDVETAVAAAEAGADFIGIMFAESRRKVTPQQCFDIVEAIHEQRRNQTPVMIAGPEPGEVSGRSWFGAWNEAIEEALFTHRPLVVGVFAEQAAEDVIAIAEAARIDLIQLSGGEDDAFVRSMTMPTVRVVHVAEGDNAGDALNRAPAGTGQAVMLDTGSARVRGGTGVAFDWTVAAEVGRAVPVMLAGGLTPENVGEAVTTAEPWAVDVSTGVETDGNKDIEKIRAFIKAAKGASA